jgi:hypothetical protein
MKDISKPRTLFEFHGKLFETIGYATEKTVIIQPIRERDYKKCECGRPLPSQQEEHVLSAPSIQDGIGIVYTPEGEAES